MHDIHTVIDTSGITIQPISFEEIAQWDHAIVVEADNRVQALREMYNTLSEDNAFNLILWDDPNHPAHMSLAENILDGWEHEFDTYQMPVPEAVKHLEKSMDTALRNAGEFYNQIQIITDYSRGFFGDLAQSFSDKLMTASAKTMHTYEGVSNGQPIKGHADPGGKASVRFMTTAHGEPTFVAENKFAEKVFGGWAHSDPENAVWRSLPRSSVSIVAKTSQKEIPSLHTHPFYLHEEDKSKRFRIMANVNTPDDPYHELL